MADLELTAQPRTITGRRVKQLRQQGLVPVVVYGNVDEPENLQIPARSMEVLLRKGGGSQLVELQVEGGRKHNVLFREIQRHPVRHNLMHADFYAVSMREKQQVSIPITAVGEPEALEPGLMLLQALDSIELEALPANIPASIEVDVTGLDLDNAINVADLPAIDGVEYLADPDEPVFNMILTRAGASEEEEDLEGAPEMGEVEVIGADKAEEETA